MRHLEETLHGRVSLVMSSTLQIEESVQDADVVIGAVLVPGALAPKLLTREMVEGMKQGSVIVDVAIDQGGCVGDVTRDDARRSDLRGRRRHPLLRRQHAGRRADHVTKALTNVTLPYVEAIADHGARRGCAPTRRSPGRQHDRR